MEHELCQYSTLPLLIINTEGEALQFNAAFCEYWNADPEKLRGSRSFNAFEDPIFRQADLAGRLHRVFEGIPVRLEAFDYHLPEAYLRAAGKSLVWRSISIFAIPMPTDAGAVAVALFFYDKSMSCARELPDSFCERLAAAAVALKDLRHEINNPLLLIIGHAQLLMAKPEKLSPEVSAKLEKILASAEKIRNIVQERQMLADLLVANERTELIEA